MAGTICADLTLSGVNFTISPAARRVFECQVQVEILAQHSETLHLNASVLDNSTHYRDGYFFSKIAFNIIFIYDIMTMFYSIPELKETLSMINKTVNS